MTLNLLNRKGNWMNDYKECEVCGRTAVNRHHVFYGTANRKMSEKYNCVMWVCVECHQRIHTDSTLSKRYKKEHQRAFEKAYNREKFMEVFGRSWL